MSPSPPPAPQHSCSVSCTGHSVYATYWSITCSADQAKGRQKLVSGSGKWIFARLLYLGWFRALGLSSRRRMLAGGVSRWVSENSTYLMQWAAVRTQFWATRVPPQVWRHWP